MAVPDDLLLSSYRFPLPEDRIAQSPPQVRGGSRLLVLDKADGGIVDAMFSDLLDFLPENCLLIANNSRVIPARLHGRRESGGKVEFLLLTPLPLVKEESASSDAQGNGWKHAQAEGLLRSSKYVRIGETVSFSDDLSLELLERSDFGRCKVRLRWKGDLESLFVGLGRLPLPPYIRRPEGDGEGSWGSDRERYQTAYARDDKAGSVAAPTAGLHFTPAMKEAVVASGRDWAEATLYVGYGTFSPVRCQDIREHPMHAEYVELSEETARAVIQAKQQGRPVLAVGTTSARILEGVYAARKQAGEQNGLAAHSGWINIFLYPGRSFNVIDGLITNFHLPESSLLMLVSALAGRKTILDAYAHAIREGYRFFSYGDAMLIR